MKKETIPPKDHDAEEDAFMLANAASGTECTGLIQVLPLSEEEEAHYEEVYRYTPTIPKPKHQDLRTANPAENLRVPTPPQK